VKKTWFRQSALAIGGCVSVSFFSWDSSTVDGLLKSISSTCLHAAFMLKNPKVQKDSQVISVVLHFWDLQEKELLVNCYLNWHQVVKVGLGESSVTSVCSVVFKFVTFGTVEKKLLADIIKETSSCLKFVSKIDKLANHSFFQILFLVCPIWLPVFSFFSLIEWTRIGCRNRSLHGFDTTSI